MFLAHYVFKDLKTVLKKRFLIGDNMLEWIFRGNNYKNKDNIIKYFNDNVDDINEINNFN